MSQVEEVGDVTEDDVPRRRSHREEGNDVTMDDVAGMVDEEIT